MAATLKELQERKNKKNAEVQEMCQRYQKQGQKWKDGEERNAWVQVNKDYDDLKDQVEAAKEAEDIDARAKALADEESASVNSRSGIPGREDTRNQRSLEDNPNDQQFDDDQYRSALNGWVRGEDFASEEQRQNMRRCGLSFREKNPSLYAADHGAELQVRYRTTGAAASERRQYVPGQREERSRQSRMSGMTGSTGGYAIRPSTMGNRLEMNMLAFGGMRQVAEVMQTETGEPFEWPTFDDTANVGSQVGEGDVGTAADPTFGKVIWNSYMITSGVLKVPFTLMRDAAMDLVGVCIEPSLGERLGRKSNTLYTTGTGAAQARGIIPCSTSGVTTASATAFTAAEIMALIHSIDPAYRALGCGFMSHDNILLAIRQMVDSQQRPLYVAGMVDGMPDKVYGYPHTTNQDMDSAVTATKKTLLFGQLNKYKIRRVGGPRLKRMDERYGDEDKVGFISFLSEDGNLLNAGTQPVKYMTQHA